MVSLEFGAELPYLEVLLGREDFAEQLASANTESVSQEPDLLNIVRSEFGDMRFKVGLGVELEALSLEGKEFGGGNHSEVYRRRQT